MDDVYVEELKTTLRSATAKVEASQDPTSLLEEADELVDQLRIDARTKDQKAQIKAFEEQIRDLRDRASLFAGAAPAASSSAGRQRLVAAQDRMAESSRRIEKTREVISEIEDTGADIITELQRNKETIDKINGSVKESKANIEKADKITTKMGKWYRRW